MPAPDKYIDTLPSPRPEASGVADITVDNMPPFESGVYPKPPVAPQPSEIDKLISRTFIQRGQIQRALGDNQRDYASFAEGLLLETRLTSALSQGGKEGLSAYVLGSIIEDLSA